MYNIHLGVYMHSKYLWFYECLRLVVHGQEGNTCSWSSVTINCVHIYINSSGLQKAPSALGSEGVYSSGSIREQEIWRGNLFPHTHMKAALGI